MFYAFCYTYTTLPLTLVEQERLIIREHIDSSRFVFLSVAMMLLVVCLFFSFCHVRSILYRGHRGRDRSVA